MPYQQEYNVALQAVAHASKLCSQIQDQLLDTETLVKSDQSPVTIADFVSQALIIATLQEHFPDDAVIGEEDSSDLKHPHNAPLLETITQWVQKVHPHATSDDILRWLDLGRPTHAHQRFWTLDPIDGTKGFLAGRQYAVALALLHEGEIVVGVLGCPNLPGEGDQRGFLFGTFQGQPARQIPLHTDSPTTTITVHAPKALSQTRFCESVESGHSNHDHSAQIASRLGITAPPYRIDSQCKYSAVSRGDASIYLRLPTRKDYREKIWDHAAGVALVKAAGGRVTDVDGAPLDFTCGHTLENNRGVIATCGPIHDEVISAVQDVL